jgi:hypothetical protein
VNIQQLINILQSNSDVSSCLSNCSNQGICKLSTSLTYICECNAHFMGKSCQTDKRPCSQVNKCLNNGTCINSQDLTSFTCQCPEGSPYFGQYCEKIINLCENVTCSFHGYCIQNQSETKCKCFNGYDGDKCENESSSVKLVKSVQWTTTVISILFISTFWIIIVLNDLLNYFKIGHKRIDINEWKSEKIHGEKSKLTKKKKRFQDEKRKLRRQVNLVLKKKAKPN